MSRQHLRINPSLDLFQTTPIQTSHESSFNQVFNPQNLISEDSPIIFNVRGSEHYIDLSQIMLYLRIKIIQENGTALTVEHNNEVAFANLPFSTIFKQVKLSLNGVQITPHSANYPYTGVFDTVLGQL